MRNLDLIGFLLAGIALGVPLTAVLSGWYDRRKSNVVELPKREASNVVPLDAWRAGSNVRPMLPRKWGA